jgi:EAL domain-containing protein (putative c-di-GMP-specific phosphodiesterase class I)
VTQPGGPHPWHLLISRGYLALLTGLAVVVLATLFFGIQERSRNLALRVQYFTHALNQRIGRRLALEEHMRGALERGEFSVMYQPLMDIHTREIVGAEALLRWHNKALGDVPPDEFIPVAENSGLILPIGRHVLKEAMRTLAAWRRATGKQLVMSVNISPRQLFDENLPASVARALEETQCPGHCLQLEVTEGVLLSGHGDIDGVFRALSDLRVRVAMDDLGTGYSSLRYLRRYPFDTIKIDRSFIVDLGSDPTNGELVSATIVMAHSLGLTVIAEGVESEMQLDFLAGQHCDVAQGYLIGMPLPAHSLPGNRRGRANADPSG